MSARNLFALIAALAVLHYAPAHAADEKAPADKDATMEQAAQDDAKAGGNPYLPKLQAKSKEIGNTLDKFALAHLYTVREGFGVISAVEIVRRDVGDAVKACGKDNPDIKATMNERFSSWTGKVDPVIKDRQAAIDAAIRQQDYTPVKNVQDYLKLIKQTADYANRKMDKRIVTTPEACKGLLTSMDETEDVVSKLLGEVTMLPWPPESQPPAPKATVPN